MPTQTELMTGAELACTRAFLGFTQHQLAEYLQASAPRRDEDDDEPPEPVEIQKRVMNAARRIQRMERGEAAIPTGIIDEIDEMYEVATNLVNNLILQYKAKVKKADGLEDVVLPTQRDGDTSGRYPPCWHRAVCARVAAAVPGVIIEYQD
jgi:hypothetical protein